MPPLADVLIVTYNHGPFIEQAIESVLAQQTDFDFRILVGDDGSPDQTPALVRSLAEKYPRRIRTMLYSKNVGLRDKNAVGFRLFDLSTAKYFALLEGDAFWTSSHKLQKQVSYLETRPGCPMCYHLVEGVMESEDGRWEVRGPRWPTHAPQNLSFDEILQGQPCHINSALFRRDLLDNCLEGMESLLIRDWPIILHYAYRGRLACLDEVLSAYRLHAGGAWVSMDIVERHQETLKMFEFVFQRYHHGHRTRILMKTADRYKELAQEFEARGDAQHSKTCMVHHARTKLRIPALPTGQELKMTLRLVFPELYRRWKLTNE